MKIIFTVTDPGIIDDYEDIHPDLVIQDFYSNFREWRDSGDFSVGVSKSDKPTPQSTGDKSPQICGSCGYPVKLHWKYCQRCKSLLSAVGRKLCT